MVKAKYFKLKLDDGDIIATVQNFLKKLMETKAVDALLVPMEVPSGNNIVPTLITDPGKLSAAIPFAFVSPQNSAPLLGEVAEIKASDSSYKIGAVLKPCEARAAIELMKLNQINPDGVVLISMDCMGTFKTKDYAKLAVELGAPDECVSTKLIDKVLTTKEPGYNGYEYRSACKVCEHRIPAEGMADIVIGLFGADVKDHVMIQVNNEKGEAAVGALGLSDSDVFDPANREQAVEQIKAHSTAVLEASLEEMRAKTKDIPSLLSTFATCIKCYNCRDACPICYCKECLFLTPTFNPSPKNFQLSVEKKGAMRMPHDILIYQITRMNHMITSCVACGQCEDSCPNDIPLLSLYKAIGRDVQAIFDYLPGQDLEETMPLSDFKEDELAPR